MFIKNPLRQISSFIRRKKLGLTESKERAILSRATIHNTPKLSLSTNNQRVLCKIVSVIDGDTVDFVTLYRGKAVCARLRLAGINAPELKPSLAAVGRERIINNAVESREFLKRLVADKLCYVDIHAKPEKYGRWLGDIYLKITDDVSVNQLLVQTNHAENYMQ